MNIDEILQGMVQKSLGQETLANISVPDLSMSYNKPPYGGWLKNLHNCDPLDADLDLLENSSNEDLIKYDGWIDANFDRNEQHNKKGVAVHDISHFIHEECGVVYSIEKDVQLAMDATKNGFDNAPLGNLLLMSKSVLINYEKSDQSQIIIQKFTFNELLEATRRIKPTNKAELVDLLCLHKGIRQSLKDLQLKYPEVADFNTTIICHNHLATGEFGWFTANQSMADLRDGIMRDGDPNAPWIEENDSTYIDRLECVAYLEKAFKVLAFTSVPWIKPEPISKKKKILKKLKAQGEKLPSKGGVFRVSYLPVHLRRRAKSRVSSGQGNKLVNGRAGHIRVYQDDRYVNAKGKWQYIEPLPDKNGKFPPHCYKVTRPPKDAKPLDI